MNRSCRWLPLTAVLVLVVLVPAARSQERSLDVSVGRIVFDYVPTSSSTDLGGAPSQAAITFRDTRSGGSWVMASAAVPTADDAMGWGAVAVNQRLLWPRRSRARGPAVGATLAGQLYTFRQRGDTSTGVGGTGEVRGLAQLPAGGAHVEVHGGWRGHALTFNGPTTRRESLDAGVRLVVPGPLRLEAESKWTRIGTDVLPFAGLMVFAYGRSPIYAWAQAGRWFGRAPYDALAWNAGVGVTLGGRSRIWVTVRQDAPDPLYRSGQRRTWTAGFTRLLGRRTPRTTTRVETGGSTLVTLRVPVAEAPAGPVAVAGTFTDWQPRSMARTGDAWVLQLPIATGVYDYAFKGADGRWFVPASTPGRRSDGMGGYSAVLVVP